MRLVLWIVLLIALAVCAALAISAWHWRRDSARVRSRLASAAVATPALAADTMPLATLPPPVARYLRAVLPAEASATHVAEFGERGQFLMRPRPDGWRPFTARHMATIAPAGFVWDARVQAAPGWRSTCAMGSSAARG